MAVLKNGLLDNNNDRLALKPAAAQTGTGNLAGTYSINPSLQKNTVGATAIDSAAMTAQAVQTANQPNPADTNGGKFAITPTKKSSGGGSTAAVATPSPVQPENWSSGYTPSQNVTDAMAYLQQQEQAIADQGTYGGSPYDADIQAAYDKIMGRGPFQYQVNDDALYQMYRDLYAENGRQASLDAQGQAAALTGGYGNSYAAAAGNAAYDQYMTQLNDKALDLYDRAYQRWQDEGTELQQRWGMARDMGEQDYSRWTDAYNRALAERDYAYGKYGDEWNRDYSLYSAQQQQDYGLAMAMIQAGMVPSGQILRNAGISDEDYATLAAYYKKANASRGRATPAAETPTGLDAVAEYINKQVDAGNIDPDTGIDVYNAIAGGSPQYTGTTAPTSVGTRTTGSNLYDARTDAKVVQPKTKKNT